MPIVYPHKIEMPSLDPEVRRSNWDEVATGYTEEQAVAEAQRCIQCQDPRCELGCPVNVPIREFIRCVALRDFEGAARAIRRKNLLPAICGRVCPVEHQCEFHCVVLGKQEPVAIGRLERFVADWQRAHPSNGAVEAVARRSGKVAIVGSGPSGLTAASDLAQLGYSVTVFEALHAIGGVLRYGIPEYRLPKAIVDEDVEHLRSMGVEFLTNVIIGKTVTIDQLLEEEGYDAVFIGTGAGCPLFLNIPGENLKGVYSANEYLTRVNLMGAYRPDSDTPVLHVAESHAPLAAKRELQQRAKPGTVFEHQQVARRAVHETMIRRDHQQGLGAGEPLQQFAERVVHPLELGAHLRTRHAVLVRQRVEFGPVCIDELALRPRFHRRRHLGDEPVEAVIGAPLRSAAVVEVVIGIHDRACRHHDRAPCQPIEQRRLDEQMLVRDAAQAERQVVAARAKRQRRGDTAGDAEVSEPAGETVLGRRGAGERGRDCGRGGGRKHGADRSAPAARQVAGRPVRGEIVVAEAVHDPEHDVARAGELGGRQQFKRRVARLDVAGCGERSDQVDEAAAGIIGKCHGALGQKGAILAALRRRLSARASN